MESSDGTEVFTLKLDRPWLWTPYREGFYIEVLVNDRGIKSGKHWMDWSRWCSDSRYTKEEERDARKQIGLDVYQGDFIEYLTGWPPEKSEAVNLNHFRSVLTEPLTFCGFEPLSHLPDVRMRVLSLIDAGSQNVKELQPVLPVKGTS